MKNIKIEGLDENDLSKYSIKYLGTIEGGKLGGETNKLSGHISKLGKTNGATNGKSENSRNASSINGKKLVESGFIYTIATYEGRSKGGKVAGKKRVQHKDFKKHLKNITKKSVESRINTKLEKFKSILKFIRKKEFTYSDMRTACKKYGIVENRLFGEAKKILKEKSLIKQIHKGYNQYNPSLYIKNK